MRTLFLFAVCLFLLSCSKQDDLKIDDGSLVKNTESVQKVVAVHHESSVTKNGEKELAATDHIWERHVILSAVHPAIIPVIPAHKLK